MSAPLLVLCALGPEAWALRGGDWSGAAGGPPVLARTGMGRRAAGRRAAALLDAGGYGALLVAGFGAALGPGVRPGEVIVADRVTDAEGGDHPLASAPALATALEEAGLRVHLGTHRTADRVVRGAERARLHRAGALAVDMEAAAVLAARAAHAPDLPAAVLRVVVDTPERELIRPGTLPAGVRAWQALRAAVPALTAWHRQAVAAPAQPTNPQPSTLPQEAS
ncbi:phosphorylase superfamily protein [Kitasatospora sp. SolWspMP-SS2h]|uniref:phosphorylase family protein n=1 Tax=Kitasatospora sp. SolWspMP-SS2h TaxID=1305729 RepID=UPI000DB9641C|nr:1-hydroxy-2-methyl-2-butenyl 4-diphosphate reductase [Kitasatospora sp. SolWspMP-SS2h]RAJ40366.1 phosphorylase superfamily protein [Kitasatospora sp. SolWspMP-SS2h]